MKTFLVYAAGCATPFILWFANIAVVEFLDWLYFKWNEPKKGTWVIHSYAREGSTSYSNGGRYTIYRYGCGANERATWDPPMFTEEDALKECARRNCENS